MPNEATFAEACPGCRTKGPGYFSSACGYSLTLINLCVFNLLSLFLHDWVKLEVNIAYPDYGIFKKRTRIEIILGLFYMVAQYPVDGDTIRTDDVPTGSGVYGSSITAVRAFLLTGLVASFVGPMWMFAMCLSDKKVSKGFCKKWANLFLFVGPACIGLGSFATIIGCAVFARMDLPTTETVDFASYGLLSDLDIQRKTQFSVENEYAGLSICFYMCVISGCLGILFFILLVVGGIRIYRSRKHLLEAPGQQESSSSRSTPGTTLHIIGPTPRLTSDPRFTHSRRTNLSVPSRTYSAPRVSPSNRNSLLTLRAPSVTRIHGQAVTVLHQNPAINMRQGKNVPRENNRLRPVAVSPPSYQESISPTAVGDPPAYQENNKQVAVTPPVYEENCQGATAPPPYQERDTLQTAAN